MLTTSLERRSAWSRVVRCVWGTETQVGEHPRGVVRLVGYLDQAHRTAAAGRQGRLLLREQIGRVISSEFVERSLDDTRKQIGAKLEAARSATADKADEALDELDAALSKLETRLDKYDRT